MIDLIYKYEAAIRLTAFIGGFTMLALWEWAKPKRELTQIKFKRWLSNFALLATSTILVRLLIPMAAIGSAYLVEQNQWGLVNFFELPFWLKALITFVLLDLSIYLQHVMFHVLPIMWRIHRVHHTDLDCDVSTGLRFHPLEIFISIVIKIFTIILFGAPVIVVILFEVMLNIMSMFTHSNIYLNTAFERVLRLFFVTPDMHRIHHSVRENETNSNFSFNISLWDRLFGTYINAPAAGHLDMVIGLNQFRKPEWHDLQGLVCTPFTNKLKGYAINYRDTVNADELEFAKEKAKLTAELSSYLQAIGKLALVSVTDTTGKIIQANDKFCDVSGYTEEELIGQNHRIVNSGTHPASFFANMWKTISSGHTWHEEVCDRAKDGSLYWVDSTLVPITDNKGKIERYLSVRVDITERKRHELELEQAYQNLTEANSQLEKLSRIDALTQIANRRHFDEMMESEVNRMRRMKTPLTLILCDVDFFKDYNDSYGHLEGDTCLQRVTQSIKSIFTREGDLVARYGGEEFAIILPNINKETALNLAEQIRINIQKLKLTHDSSAVAKVVTVSSGVTTLIPGKYTTGSTLIKRADKALYKAKEKGRNNVQYYEEPSN